ncbi:MAG TPA: DUF6152 family protein [Vicinamibacterales bacterium]|nr:DUF6152 family protein [Vicinamibacterales bacterium]
MRRVLLGAVMCIAASLPVLAHHSTTAEFDVQHRTTVSGTLTKVDWVNPHIVVFIEAMGAAGAGKVAWKFESNPPAWFRRVGVSRADFAKAIGQKVTVEGNRAKDGSLYGYLLKITYADGNALELVIPGADR